MMSSEVHDLARQMIDTAARTRRSVRDYQPVAVSVAEVREVIELAARAPSAWNLQPWRFLLVSDPPTKQALQEAAFGQRQVAAAPIVIVLYSDMDDALTRVDEILHPSMPPDALAATRERILGSFASMPLEKRDAWGLAQANIALGYLLLLLEVHGYGTSPMLGFDPPAVRAMFGLPENAQIAALVAIGQPIPGPVIPQHRLPADRTLREAVKMTPEP
jgi:nitroreductase